MKERARVVGRNCRQLTLCEAEEFLVFFWVLAGRIFGYRGAAQPRKEFATSAPCWAEFRSASNCLSMRGGAPTILGLLIKAHGAKPTVMKTPSGTFAFVVLAVIVTVAVVSCSPTDKKIVSNQKFSLRIGTKTITKTTYVDWTSDDQFDEALKQVCQNGGSYTIEKLKPGGKPYNAKPCIKTDKVTKSKVADDAAAGESAGNDPNVTNRVAAANKADILTVLNALQ
jgi:hypothetical protein